MKQSTMIMAVSSLLAGGCTSGFLDLSPMNDLRADAVFSDPALVEAFVNAAYGEGVRHGFWRNRDISVVGLSGDVRHTHWYGTEEFAKGRTTPDNGENATGNLWRDSYRVIRNINTFFANIEGSPLEQERKAQLIAEMQFIRAWVYADLVRWYGGVPLIDEVLTTRDTQRFHAIARSTYDEVVARIVGDLDAAIAVLPPTRNGGKATGIAAMALKSRVLLYAASLLNNPLNDPGKWIAAHDATRAAIDALGDQALHPDYGEVFLSVTTETLWARYFVGGGTGQGHIVNLSNNPNGHNGWGGNTPLQALVDAYDMSNGLPITDPASGYDPQNPYVNRDPRFYATINFNGAMWKGRPIETFNGGLDTKEGPVQHWNGTHTGYYTRKYLDESAPISETIKSTTPWPFFRKAELYLNYAETLLALGDEVNAKIWMNKTRARAGMPDIALESGPALVERYRQERRVELAIEGHRFFDILRWKIAEHVLAGPARGVTITIGPGGVPVYDYETKDPIPGRSFDPTKHYRMPIPRSEIDKAPMLLQNPGYGCGEQGQPPCFSP